MVKWTPHREWSNGSTHPKAIRDVSETTGGIIMWAIGYDDGSHHIDKHHSECCAMIDSQPRVCASDLYVSLRDYGDVTKWWWTNLLDPLTTLWPGLIRDEITIYEPEHNKFDHVFHLKIDKNTRFKDTVNLMIATRQGSEMPGHVVDTKKWYDKIVPYGGTFSEAVALSAMQNPTREGAYKLENVGAFMGGHTFLSTTSVPARVAQRKPLDFGTRFQSTHTYRTDDYIWGKNDDNPYAGKGVYYGYPPSDPTWDIMRWKDALKNFDLSARPELASAFFRRNLDIEKGVKDTYNISIPCMLDLLRTFELKDTVDGHVDHDMDDDLFFDDDDF